MSLHPPLCRSARATTSRRKSGHQHLLHAVTCGEITGNPDLRRRTALHESRNDDDTIFFRGAERVGIAATDIADGDAKTVGADRAKDSPQVSPRSLGLVGRRRDVENELDVFAWW